MSAGLGAALVNELLARGADADGRAVLLPLSPPHTVDSAAPWQGAEPAPARFAEYALPRLLLPGYNRRARRAGPGGRFSLVIAVI